MAPSVAGAVSREYGADGKELAVKAISICCSSTTIFYIIRFLLVQAGSWRCLAHPAGSPQNCNKWIHQRTCDPTGAQTKTPAACVWLAIDQG